MPGMTTALLVGLGLIAALWVWLWASPIHRVAFRDVLDAEPAGSGIGAPPASADAASRLPHVTVIAPARNEAAVLPVTVPTYCGQAYPNLEVLVVDDQSDDATPAVLTDLAARFPNFRTVRTGERPAGWLGKPWAVASGVEHLLAAAGGAPASDVAATAGSNAPPDLGSDLGPLYCFTDADCAFHPRAVATAVRAMRAAGADMLSVVPRMEFTPACEKVGLPGLVTVLTMLFPFGRVNDPASPLALAAGGFILIRRSAYEQIGGHAAVRAQVNEDVTLARRAKAAGVRLRTVLTRDLVTTHMYDDWADLWEGLSKNAYAGMDYDPKKFWVGAAVGVLAVVLPPAYLLAGVAWAAARPASPAAWAFAVLAAVTVVAQAAVHGRTTRHMGLPIYHALMMPASAGLYIAIAADSAYQHHYRGGNVWKGRRMADAAAASAAE